MFENQPRVGPGGAPPSRPGLDGGGGRVGSRRRRLRTRPALPSRRKRAPAATSAEGPGRGREPGSAPSSPRQRALTSCQKDRVGDAGRRDAFIPAAPRGESRATGSAAAARPPVPGTGAGAGAPRGAARARVVVTGDGEGGANPGRNARAHTRPRGGGGSGRLLLGRGGGRGDRPTGAELRRRECPSGACVGGAQEVVCPEAKRTPEAPPPCVTGRGGAIAVGGASQLSAANRVENSNVNPDWSPSAELERGPPSVVSSAGSPSWLLCACSVWSFPHVASFFLDGSEASCTPMVP